MKSLLLFLSIVKAFPHLISFLPYIPQYAPVLKYGYVLTSVISHIFAGSHPQSFLRSRFGVGLRIFITNVFLGDGNVSQSHTSRTMALHTMPFSYWTNFKAIPQYYQILSLIQFSWFSQKHPFYRWFTLVNFKVHPLYLVARSVTFILCICQANQSSLPPPPICLLFTTL